MEIGGLPLHPLVVHATVVLVPLTAVLVSVFALLTRWRWLTRLPAALMAAAAPVLAWAATLSGEALLKDRPEVAPLVERHEQLGEILAYALIPFAAVVLLAAWALPGGTALASGRGARDSRVPALDTLLPPLLVLFALGVLVLVVLVGDSGARAVWAG